MSSFGRQFSTESPVLAMTPQPAHQTPFGAATFSQQFPSSSFAHDSTPNTPAMAGIKSSSVLGRKRSRDEAAINLDPDLPPLKVDEPEEEWVYGPGMTLIKAKKGYVSDAGSQSGTWLEEKKATDEETRLKAEQELLPARSFKSQRIIQSFEDDNSQSMPISAPSPVKAEPVIDDFTLHLGIGWRKISEDEHIQAAARGWARFIENHYPVTNAHIRLESSGLQSYLVETDEGLYLFAEDLRQGRLVSTTVDSALRNLQNSPPIFDGAETLTATESPAPVALQPGMLLADAEMSMG